MMTAGAATVSSSSATAAGGLTPDRVKGGIDRMVKSRSFGTVKRGSRFRGARSAPVKSVASGPRDNHSLIETNSKENRKVLESREGVDGQVIRTRLIAIAAVMLMASLSGCMPSNQPGDPTSATTREEAAPVDDKLTWQKAKAHLQDMEQEIANLIPEEKVAKIDQKTTGILFECDKAQHLWKGSTAVTLSAGTDPEPIVKAIENHFQDSRFNIKTGPDIVGDYRVQLRSPDTSENYIIVKDGPGEIGIASGSPCFTLPDGVYPGGDFEVSELHPWALGSGVTRSRPVGWPGVRHPIDRAVGPAGLQADELLLDVPAAQSFAERARVPVGEGCCR